MSTANARVGESPSSGLESASQMIKDKAEGIAGAVSDTAKAVKDNVARMATSAAGATQKAWDGTRHAAQDIGTEVAQRAEVVHADAVIFIRSHPIATVFGALGVGILLGGVLCGVARGRG